MREEIEIEIGQKSEKKFSALRKFRRLARFRDAGSALTKFQPKTRNTSGNCCPDFKVWARSADSGECCGASAGLDEIEELLLTSNVEVGEWVQGHKQSLELDHPSSRYDGTREGRRAPAENKFEREFGQSAISRRRKRVVRRLTYGLDR